FLHHLVIARWIPPSVSVIDLKVELTLGYCCCVVFMHNQFFPLHRRRYARYGELEEVEAILSSGVDANHQDAHGNTALHLSC
ncbi:unnamed protein product, partial [Ectocarpus sp. 12 AP-2014]